MSVPPPSFVLETGLYASDLEAGEQFYHGVLGLEVLFREAGRHVFFRCGTGVVLLFRPEATRRGKTLPPHGAEGAGHVAFAVETSRLEAWRDHLSDHGIEVEHEQDWGDRGCSLYVRDPAGNSVELATPTLWDTATRDDWLRQLRPHLGPGPSERGPVERFRHATLQPLLEMLTSSILRLIVAHLDRDDIPFAALDRSQQRDHLRTLLTQDEALIDTLLGMLIGHFTEEELTTYLAHRAEVRRRVETMLLARVQEQVDTIAERADA